MGWADRPFWLLGTRKYGNFRPLNRFSENGLKSENMATSHPKQPVADTVLKNGAIYTVNTDQPWAEAVAICDGRFVFVGENDVLDACTAPETTTVDLDGRFGLLSFHDMHTHSMEAVFACGVLADGWGETNLIVA